MKFFAFIIFISLKALAVDQAVYDENGFARCFKTDSKTYFFEWDHFIRTPEKTVTYFELEDYNKTAGHNARSCNDYKFLDEVPSEILRNLAEIKNILPERILLSLEQVSHGAHKFRFEKTAEEYIANRKDIFKADSPEVLSQLRHDVGDKFTTEVINYFTKNIAVRGLSCDTLIGSCDFYLCQEQKNPCGLDGYNLGYGYKYCSGSKFKLLIEMTTDLGKNWVTDVFQCLQKRNLEDSANLAKDENICSEIKKKSYSSHPDCYVQAGFCQLKGSEKHHIFSLIKKEIISAQTLIQGFEILKQCAGDK